MKKKKSIVVIGTLLCLFMIAMPVIGSSIYFNLVVSDKLEHVARSTASFYLDQLSRSTESTLGAIRDTIYYLTTDEAVQQIMDDTHNTTMQQCLAMEVTLGKSPFLRPLLETHTVTGMYLFQADGTCLPIMQSGIYAGNAARAQRVYANAGDQNSAKTLYTHECFANYCYVVVDYVTMDTLVPIGKIIIELNADQLLASASIEQVYDHPVVLLTDLGGVPINNQPLTFTPHAVQAEGEYVTIEDTKYYYANKQLHSFDVAIGILIPQAEILHTAQSTTHLFFIFAVAIFILTGCIGAFGMYQIYRPFQQVLGSLDKMAAGDFNVRMDATPFVETEQLANTFNNMANHLETLFDDVYHQGLSLREAEISLLESQIRPHFIFNVLQLVHIRCLETGHADIAAIVSNLAQLLRASTLNRNRQIITLKEELQYVKYYLELQTQRFGDNLHYTISVEDDALLETPMPKLIIQPLVENSIVHGLENKRGGGSVRISVWEEARDIYIRVADDGIGFDVAAMQNAAPPPGADEAHNHIALHNIQQRLKLLYGPAYVPTVHSTPGEGTSIMVRLPRDANTLRKERPTHESDDS